MTEDCTLMLVPLRLVDAMQAIITGDAVAMPRAYPRELWKSCDATGRKSWAEAIAASPWAPKEDKPPTPEAYCCSCQEPTKDVRKPDGTWICAQCSYAEEAEG